MGRECRAPVAFGGQEGEARLRLEAEGLTLGGALRARIPRGDFLGAVAEGARLRLSTRLGDLLAEMASAKEAEAWARALMTPPPGLAQKLGIGPGRGMRLLGPVLDPVLADCVGPHQDAAGPEALAELHSEAALEALLQALPACPLWVVTLKGKASPLGEDRVRQALRAQGWKDVKTARVSDRSAATRYVPPRP